MANCGLVVSTYLGWQIEASTIERVKLGKDHIKTDRHMVHVPLKTSLLEAGALREIRRLVRRPCPHDSDELPSVYYYTF